MNMGVMQREFELIRKILLALHEKVSGGPMCLTRQGTRLRGGCKDGRAHHTARRC